MGLGLVDRIFPIREEVLAWPPAAIDSSVTVFNPSEVPYTDAARPAGPAPTTTRLHTSLAASGTGRPDDAGEFRISRIAQHLLAVPDHDGSVLAGDVQAAQQLLRPFVPLRVLTLGLSIRMGVGQGSLRSPAPVGGRGRSQVRTSRSPERRGIGGR
ncbi:hypothetical protein [Rhodococcus wratislaviensis]|uniref:hypothetical protein n=1 Tax=Rhodococcus wratislaviensis TaxID=44752 RepID=UPI0035114827